MDGSAALTDTKSPNHHIGHQHGSGARDHDRGTTTHSTVDTAGDQPKNLRATSREPSRLVRFPERWSCARRHRRPGELRRDSGQQPVSVPLNRRFPLSGWTRRVNPVDRLSRPTGQERFPGMTISYALLQTIEKMSEKPDKVRIVTTAQHSRFFSKDVASDMNGQAQ